MDVQQPAEIRYTAADIVALNLVTWRWWAGFVGIIVGLLVLIPVFLTIVDGGSLVEGFVAIDWPFAGYVLLFILSWLLVVTAFGYGWRRIRGKHGSIRYALMENGLGVRNHEMDSVIFWSAFRSVKTRQGRLFLFLSRRSALIIPRRAFENDAQFDAFATIAECNWKADVGSKP